jgi:nicotinamide-nucleotide amidase
MPDQETRRAARDLIARCTSSGLKIATAESCTGGLIAAGLTDIPGSSAVFDRGFVTYSNQAKTDLLDVPDEMITRLGAVSAEVAVAMANGALVHSLADLAVAVTGIAGPGGGTEEKPVGLVHLCALRRGSTPVSIRRLYGDVGRTEIRTAAVKDALAMLDRLSLD